MGWATQLSSPPRLHGCQYLRQEAGSFEICCGMLLMRQQCIACQHRVGVDPKGATWRQAAMVVAEVKHPFSSGT